MKTLFVLRHAKSSWDHPELSDFERPLNNRGEKAAPFMGELMRKKDLEPDIIFSSPAMRAKTTAKLVKEAAGFDAEIVFNRSVYEAGMHNLLYIVAEIGDEYDAAMIVGHNPGFEGIVRILSGNYERMPTAALAVIDLDIESWSETEPGCGQLREVLRPKDYM
jgi:phosphohistidine phosphatase